MPQIINFSSCWAATFVMYILVNTVISPTWSWAEKLGCPAWPGQAEGMRQVGGSIVEIWSQKSDLKNQTKSLCKASVRDESGNVVFEGQGEVLSMDPISGNDLNRDGLPDVVIFKRETDFSYSYFIVSPGANPPLIKHIRNKYGVRFDHTGDGSILFVITDDGFQNLPDLIDIYHYDLVVPEIRFRLIGRSLKDVSAEFWGPYDDSIRKAHSELRPADIAAFKAGEIRDSFKRGVVKGHILSIVLSYLYSEREREAWDALSDMWPPADVERIKQVILGARARGSLRLSKDP